MAAAQIISNNLLKLTFIPELGGSVISLESKLDGKWVVLTREINQKVTRAAETASFLMAPYPNRITDSCFSFQGKYYRINNGNEHALHGFVRDKPWLCSLKDDSAVLQFDSRDFADIDFPFPFSAEMKYELQGNTLTTGLKLKNRGDAAMPAGCGFHPYFRRSLASHDENVELEFRAAGVYRYEGPTPLISRAMEDLNEQEDFSEKRSLEQVFDHCFGGWQSPASIYWPESRIKLTMSASDNMKHLVIYSPQGENYFAFEPQSQVINGFNLLDLLGEESGVLILKPGKEANYWFNMQIEQF